MISTNGKTHSQWANLPANFVKIPNVPLHMKLLLPFTKSQDILKKSKRKKTKRTGKRHQIHSIHSSNKKTSKPYQAFKPIPLPSINSSPLIMIVSKFGIISFFQRNRLTPFLRCFLELLVFRGRQPIHPMVIKGYPPHPPGPPWRPLPLVVYVTPSAIPRLSRHGALKPR